MLGDVVSVRGPLRLAGEAHLVEQPPPFRARLRQIVNPHLDVMKTCHFSHFRFDPLTPRCAPQRDRGE